MMLTDRPVFARSALPCWKRAEIASRLMGRSTAASFVRNQNLLEKAEGSVTLRPERRMSMVRVK
jgi:hypothetical protein